MPHATLTALDADSIIFHKLVFAEDINESSFDTPLVINGTEILASDGKTVYKDPKTGNAIIAWQMTVVPGDAGYDTFENAVVLPTMAASTD